MWNFVVDRDVRKNFLVGLTRGILEQQQYAHEKIWEELRFAEPCSLRDWDELNNSQGRDPWGSILLAPLVIDCDFCAWLTLKTYHLHLYRLLSQQ